MATLKQGVEFYNRGGNFPSTHRQNLDVDLQPLGLTSQQKADLVVFLKLLTDPHVKYETAPFDHPSLSIPHGAKGTLFPSLLLTPWACSVREASQTTGSNSRP